MHLIEMMACTPRYVLMDGNSRIGPKVALLNSDCSCISIYGFSAKSFYDKFSLQSDLSLTPYPLVKGYLQNQVDSAGDSLMLVVVDAAGVDEPFLDAATMEAVLEAQENKASHVAVNYRLAFDQKTNDYTVTKSVL
ncbi:hypothetical protein [Adhaeretor mobilis]|uniref:Uncharacterized protein n=1 Tax=Adhaeretor mobilis TaxID=1930276 RepID=A0A517MXK5_9BACT|nr:hypothetical protein [Adhaeretor mobilis]QDS99589.1 hypothetical protein HG15A2_29150 [Adhaeretor mobilis]